MRAVVDRSVRRILLVDGPAVLGWTTWRALDAAHSGRLLVEVWAHSTTSRSTPRQPPRCSTVR